MLTDRLGIKITALLISVLLWVIVSARQPTQNLVRVSVLPVLDSSLVLLDKPPIVQALVAGRGADLLKLYATPPVIRRVVNGDAPDTLVLDVTPSDVRVPPELANDIRILDVQPRSVVLRFEPNASRRIAVVSDGRILVRDDSVIHAAVDPQFDPSSVRITGPRRFVRRLSAVHPFSLTITRGDTLPHLADLDTSGLGIRMQPSQVRVVLRQTP
ncbi:MAG: hypothetical protein ABJE47_01140 [bacterium]